jgi:hypothetical protein
MSKPSDFGPGHAYMFAPFENVHSILINGQYSRNAMEKGWNENWIDISEKDEPISRRQEFHDYATLFFGTHTPTQFYHEERGVEFAIIRYDADRLFMHNGACFSNIALQESGSEGMISSCIKNPENLEKMDWTQINSKRIIRFHPHGKWGQAELMIPKHIPKEYVIDVVFKSEGSRSNYFAEFDTNDVNHTIDESLFITPKCRNCDDIDEITLPNYDTSYCPACEHSMDLNGYCIRKWACKSCR